MKQVSGTYEKGIVVPDEPVDWPEGSHVLLRLEEAQSENSLDITVAGTPWDDSPEAAERRRRSLDEIKPLFSADEFREFQRTLRDNREAQKAALSAFDEKITKLYK